MQMDRGLIMAGLLVWGVPLINMIISRVAIPDPNRGRDTFPSAVFTPTDVKVVEKQGRKKSDSFELWLHAADGASYFHRDPESEPILTLHGSIPRNEPLKVIYSVTREGNVLMEVAVAEMVEKPILRFGDVMAEYADRRRLIEIIAGVWLLVGNVVLFLLWRADAK